MEKMVGSERIWKNPSTIGKLVDVVKRSEEQRGDQTKEEELVPI